MGKISMQNIMENLLVQWGLENLIVIFKENNNGDNNGEYHGHYG